MGLGMAALGRPAYINLGHEGDLGEDRSVEAVERHAHDVLDAAWDAGIRYLDAARSYGRAEEFLANWLHAPRIPAGAAVVGSKWGYRYVGDWRIDVEMHEVKDHSAAALDEQWAEAGRSWEPTSPCTRSTRRPSKPASPGPGRPRAARPPPHGTGRAGRRHHERPPAGGRGARGA